MKVSFKVFAQTLPAAGAPAPKPAKGKPSTAQAPKKLSPAAPKAVAPPKGVIAPKSVVPPKPDVVKAEVDAEDGSAEVAQAAPAPAPVVAQARQRVPDKPRTPGILDAKMMEPLGKRKEPPVVVLKGGRSKVVTKDGGILIYDGAVDSVIGRPPPEAGEAVIIADGSRNPVAWGVFNPHSQYRVRVLQDASEANRHPDLVLNLPALIAARVADAAALRRTLGLLPLGPQAAVSAFRLVNSEGDRLSGLVADVVSDTVVVSSSAAWVEQQRAAIEEALLKESGAARVVWRPSAAMLAEEGMGAPAAADGEEEGEGRAEEAAAAGPASDAAAPGPIVMEAGAKFRVSVMGQKTGFYSDQRENRAFIKSLSRGKQVLDLCCYSGGFAICAALGGAVSAEGVDSSAEAIGLATENAALNGLPADAVKFVKNDIEKYMREALSAGKQWDIVVLDPPKLAPSRKSLPSAVYKYKRLNSLAVRLVRPGGILMTCTCSGAMAQSNDFASVVKEAVEPTGRRMTLLRAAGAAPCHVLDPGHPEGRYLETLAFRVI